MFISDAMRVFPEAQSLVEAPVGERVEIVHILFDSVRHHYRERGLRKGVRAVCTAMSPAGVRLELEDGSTVVVDHEQARFIEIRPVERDESDTDSAAASAA